MTLTPAASTLCCYRGVCWPLECLQSFDIDEDPNVYFVLLTSLENLRLMHCGQLKSACLIDWGPAGGSSQTSWPTHNPTTNCRIRFDYKAHRLSLLSMALIICCLCLVHHGLPNYHIEPSSIWLWLTPTAFGSANSDWEATSDLLHVLSTAILIVK